MVPAANVTAKIQRGLISLVVVLCGVPLSACSSSESLGGGSKGAEFAATPGTVESAASIYQAVAKPTLAGTAVTKQELFSKLGSLSFEQYFNFLKSKSTNATVVINSIVFNNSKNKLADNAAEFLSMGSSYSTLSAYWSQLGFDPNNVTEAAFESSLASVAAYVNNTGVFPELATTIVKTAAATPTSAKICSELKAAIKGCAQADAVSGAAAISGAISSASSSDAAAAAGGCSAQLQSALKALDCNGVSTPPANSASSATPTAS